MSKQTKDETAKKEPKSGGKRAAFRAAARAKRKSYYAAQPMRTAANKKRKLRNHIRNHPADTQAVREYESGLNFGPVKGFGLTAKGAKRQRRAAA